MAGLQKNTLVNAKKYQQMQLQKDERKKQETRK